MQTHWPTLLLNLFLSCGFSKSYDFHKNIIHCFQVSEIILKICCNLLKTYFFWTEEEIRPEHNWVSDSKTKAFSFKKLFFLNQLTKWLLLIKPCNTMTANDRVYPNPLLVKLSLLFCYFLITQLIILVESTFLHFVAKQS